jgi:hypothetical protein
MSIPYPEYDEQGKIICQICGKSYSIISPTHLSRKHKINVEEYKKRFPNLELTSGAYRTLQKHVHTPIFKKQEDGKLEEQPDILRTLLKEIIVSEKPPEDISEIAYKDEKPKKKNLVFENKHRVFEELKEHLKHVEKDHVIQFIVQGGYLQYEFVTDFADPVARVIVDCPNTFWHNRDFNSDPQKFIKLLQDGWTILVLESNSPTKEQIKKLFEK